ncbi:MAG: ankyrin repeat domain-containing protein [Novosphingobium sp.]|nr:ankyrin repeat domain-containing protein [Novosphingobium sp.]
MKKYIITILLSTFILQNNITSMEENIGSRSNIESIKMKEEDSNKELDILKQLPNEMLLKIIQHIVECYINGCHDITCWRMTEKAAKENLKNLFSTCRYLGQFNNQESIDYIINTMQESTRFKRANFLKVKEAKSLELIETFSKFYSDVNAKQDKIIDLIYNGADINVKDSWNHTALMQVVEKGNKAVIEHLIKLGADVNSVDHNGETALIMAAASYDCTDIAQLLILSGANVDQKDHNGKTALIYAVIKGRKDIVGLLINTGADINAKDNNGNTALMHAVYYGHIEIVKLLIDSCVDVNVRNNDGNTALMVAESKCYRDNNNTIPFAFVLDNDNYKNIVELLKSCNINK